ncbi:pyridoxal phosphate-dependent transferase [Umbelopsis sp. AD052]|nr:pyridoxal phosphate-dependent transferase [Umbelopsis sp. AD052]
MCLLPTPMWERPFSPPVCVELPRFKLNRTTNDDARHVDNFTKGVSTTTLYAYKDPVSPHVATLEAPRDEEILEKVRKHMLGCVEDGKQVNGSYMFLETAGGVHSPAMSGTSQSELYRSLRLPTVLIGDSKLGGISTTVTSYESLQMRGYDIPEVLLFNDKAWNNHEYLAKRFNNEADVSTIPLPPMQLEDPVKELESMKKYYEQVDEHLHPVMERLDRKHQERFERLETMAQKSRDVFWWPFTQHDMVKEVTVIDSAYNDHMYTYAPEAPGKKELQPKEMFDACASWWTQGLGHANPKLTLAAAYAAGRYGHVMFPEATNEPALKLAEAMLEQNDWAQRVFFSDNGSTAMEVAIKMAIRSTTIRYGWDDKLKPEIIGLNGSYHGDTIGAMDACAPNVYNGQVQWYQPRGHWYDPPTVQTRRGKVVVTIPDEFKSKQDSVSYESMGSLFDPERLANDELKDVYERFIRQSLEGLSSQGRKFGAVLMEPVLMGSGGMVVSDPLFQKALVDVVRKDGADLLGNGTQGSSGEWQGLPIVIDEVFAGMYRLGRSRASSYLGVTPDIAAFAKVLTGGLIPLALTVTTNSIFNNFLSDNKADCLLHGHSYTAHPMGCAVAKASIDILEQLNTDGSWSHYKQDWGVKANENIWSMWNKNTVDFLSHLPNVQGVNAIGSVLAVELKDAEGKGYTSAASANIVAKMRNHQFEHTNINMFARPLGNVVYVMASQRTQPEQIKVLEQTLLQCLEEEL